MAPRADVIAPNFATLHHTRTFSSSPAFFVPLQLPSMAPKLRVLVSSSSAYPPTTECTVNSPTPTPIKTDSFEGDISVWIKDFTGDNSGGDGHEYFDKRPGMTYGIVVRGGSFSIMITEAGWRMDGGRKG